MSEGFEIDLSKLDFLPAWAKEKESSERYKNFDGGGSGASSRGGRPHQGRSFSPGGERQGRGGTGGGGRPPFNSGGRPQPGRDSARQGQGGGTRPSGQGSRDRQPGGAAAHSQGGDRRQNRGDDRRHQRGGRPDSRGGDQGSQAAQSAPIRPVTVELLPEPKGLASLVKQIKLTKRAYPIFQMAHMILEKRERFQVRVRRAKVQDAMDMFECTLDQTFWTSESDVVKHVLKTAFATYYRTDKVTVEAPKGQFTCVGICGMSQTNLGPPNHHDYQAKLRSLHSERFANMSFDAFKNRVQVSRDEAHVKAWLELQTSRDEHLPLNADEPRMKSQEEIEAHFVANYAQSVIKKVDSIDVPATEAFKKLCPEIAAAVRRFMQEETRFPMKLVNYISTQLAKEGLRFFKAQGNTTFVSVSRPHYLDLENTAVSENIRSIINYVQKRPKCTRAQMMEALASNAQAAEPSAPVAAQPAEVLPATVPVVQEQVSEAKEEAATVAEVPAAQTKVTDAAVAPAELTPQEIALLRDLRWLVDGGHLIEYYNGKLELAKKPLPPQPPAPKKDKKNKPEQQPAPVAAEGDAAVDVLSSTEQKQETADAAPDQLLPEKSDTTA